jgi:hypothetical protein
MWNRGTAVVRSDDCDGPRRGVLSKVWSSLRLGKCAEGVQCHRYSVYRKAVDSSSSRAFVDLA